MRRKQQLTIWRIGWACAALGIPGCGNPSNGSSQGGPEVAECKTLSLEEVPVDEPIGGVVPRELINLMQGTRSAALHWSTEGEQGPFAATVTTPLQENDTVLTIEMVPQESIKLRQSEWIDHECPDVLELDLQVTVSTDDGALAEPPAPVTVGHALVEGNESPVSKSGFDLRMDLRELQGSLEITVVDPESAEDVELSFRGRVSGMDLSGTLTGNVLEVLAEGQVATGRPFNLATFGSESGL